jgi:hypothetical protein
VLAASAISPGQIELDPIEIDPRPCGECGCTIDQHRRVDTPEGPEFFCVDPDEMTLDELERRAELIRQVEVAEIMARIFAFAVDDQPSNGPPADEPPPYRTAASTIDAFKYVSLNAIIWRAGLPMVLRTPSSYSRFEGKQR